MSNRRRPSALDVAAKRGYRIPGGCDDCDAYQTVKATDYGHNITIHHDDSCPFYLGLTR